MEIQLEGNELHVAGQDLTSIPAFLGENYGSVVKCLNLSFNSIKRLTNLELFKGLESLVVDNNELVSDQDLPRMESLHTLSVNSNMIDDLEVFLDAVVAACPALTFLSLWKNQCCPNEMVGRDSDDYKRYRFYVLHRIPTLKYLDSTAIKPEELREAKRVGALMRVAKPKPRAMSSAGGAAASGNGSGEDGEEAYAAMGPDGAPEQEYPALPQDISDGAGEAGPSRFGRSRYVYYGKQSEGNRFILNSDL